MRRGKLYFSILIPTLNEEKYIETAIKSVINQTFRYSEIIVIDGKSKDKTREIAKKYCKTLAAPKSGISNQLNYGIKFAKGKYICFMDADTKIAPDTLRKIYLATKNDNSIIAGTCSYAYDDNSLKFKILSKIVTIGFFILRQGGSFFFAKRSVFKKIKFNQSYIAHDTNFLDTVKKFGKFKFLLGTFLFTSTRRFKDEGFLNTISKHALLFTGTLLKRNFINKNSYEFGKHTY